MMHITFSAQKINYEKIAKFIKNDNLIIYPTDTVYGVGAQMYSEEALRKLYIAKSRDFNSPLIALVSNKNIVEEIANIPEKNREKFQKLIEKFWPGGLTIILEKKDCVPSIMVSNGKTVGVRMPNHDVALKIIEAVGGVLPTTSANISGEHTPRSYQELSAEFKDKIDLIVNGGECPVGKESTIIDLSGKKIKILRSGAISKEMIEEIIGKF